MRKISLIVTLCLFPLITASLAFAVPVEGRVVNQDGASQVKVKVEFSSTSDSRQYSAWTDDRGSFSIADVAEGHYKVVVAGRDKQYDVTVDGSGMHPNPLIVD